LRTRCFSADNFDVEVVPAGSLLVMYASDPKAAALVAGGRRVVARAIIDAGW